MEAGMFRAYIHFMATRTKTLFQIKSGDPDESAFVKQSHDCPNYQLTATLTKSKAGSFLHYYHNLNSTSFPPR
jgi:hypothetical protein